MRQESPQLEWKYQDGAKWHSIKGMGQEGAHGVYFQLTRNKGIKILVNEKWGQARQFNNIHELKKSTLWDKAVQEYRTLSKTSKSKITPKVYKMTVVENDLGLVYPGIIMEHIEGELLLEAKIIRKFSNFVDKNGKILMNTSRPVNKVLWEDFLSGKLSEFGIKHLDLTESNVMVTKNRKLKVIDFGLVSSLDED